MSKAKPSLWKALKILRIMRRFAYTIEAHLVDNAWNGGLSG
jgi:hypothetical protein